MRILFVDDTRLAREMAGAWLGAAGHTVTLAKDGLEAWELWQRDRHDIVVTDYEMPGWNGVELCWAIRAAAPWQACYIIVVTASDERGIYLEALDAGADEFILKPIDSTVLRARVRAGERIVTAFSELSRVARTDLLTGLLNRTGFMARAEEEFLRAQRQLGALTVLLCDIDHFKKVNDTYGHAAGDDALRQFADAIRDTLRGYDLIGRIGGEEFCLILPGAILADGVMAADRLRRRVEATSVLSGGIRLSITTSIGVAQVRGSDVSIDGTIARADAALYAAKHAGRNRVFSSELISTEQNPGRPDGVPVVETAAQA
jgi:two-component system, cell cycle response regulator